MLQMLLPFTKKHWRRAFNIIEALQGKFLLANRGITVLADHAHPPLDLLEQRI